MKKIAKKLYLALLLFLTTQDCFAQATEKSLSVKIEESDPELIRAVKRDNGEKIRELIAAGAKVNEQEDKDGRKALHWAAMLGHDNALKALLEADDIDVDIRTRDLKNTPLIIACSGFFGLSMGLHLEAVKMLLEKGAKVNIQNRAGEAALFSAVLRNNKQGCLLLLKHGADDLIKDSDGETIYDLYLRKNIKGDSYYKIDKQIIKAILLAKYGYIKGYAKYCSLQTLLSLSDALDYAEKYI